MRYFLLNQRDEFIGKLSQFRAQEAIAAGRVEQVNPDTVKLTAPHKPKPEENRENLLNGGSMRDTWHVEESAGYFVMQMRSVNPEENAS